ncbi:MAG: sigma-54 dependent transcriptional regulator [Deltaproteobacteria bacterium]|nr:sigma-54 dependent transcriptional regulator [Deltaproteobacteria bacterium]
MAKILFIDDDRQLCKVLGRKVTGMGHDAMSVYTLADGLQEIARDSYDVVFLDVRLPDGNGLEILPAIRESSSQPEVIIMTGKGDPNGAELAIKSGAWDYIEKPSSISDMVLPLVRALQYREAKRAAEAAVMVRRGGIIGKSVQIRDCLDQVGHAAASNVSVLITGETGTGKELFAWAIHANSPRAHRSFVAVDCASLSDTLVDSVLFGYEKGAYTGADQARDGLILQADGGTLFLDEVGELPLAIQKTFLRVLQEHRFRPLGRKNELQSDFRLVAATNRDLDQMVREGQFRSDLFFRLRSFTIELPPLRKHPGDIREIATQCMKRFCECNKTGPKKFSPEFLDAIEIYDWPGNVRELINTLERVFTVALHETTIFPYHLPIPIRVKIARASIWKGMAEPSASSGSDEEEFPTIQDLRDTTITKVEREYLKSLMSFSGGDINRACELSGLRRSRLYELMKKYKLSGYSKFAPVPFEEFPHPVEQHLHMNEAVSPDQTDRSQHGDDTDD